MAALRLSAVALLGALVGCYDVPQPACGFQCGPSSNRDVCPNGYSCDFGRCVLIGYTGECPAIIDPEVTDRTPPGIQARSPMVDQTGVELDAIILVTFDEEVTDVDASTFGLRLGGTFVNGAVSSASPGRAFRFVPSRNLAPNGNYEVVLGTAIMDLAGNNLAETRWSFSTIEDVTGPMLVSSTPMNGALDVPLDTAIDLVFDEPITSNSLSSVRLEQNGVAETITLSIPMSNTIAISHDPLAANTTYTIVITDELTDLAGNPVTPTTLTFTTTDP
jgi:hypothetical protein